MDGLGLLGLRQTAGGPHVANSEPLNTSTLFFWLFFHQSSYLSIRLICIHAEDSVAARLLFGFQLFSGRNRRRTFGRDGCRLARRQLATHVLPRHIAAICLVFVGRDGW